MSTPNLPPALAQAAEAAADDNVTHLNSLDDERLAYLGGHEDGIRWLWQHLLEQAPELPECPNYIAHPQSVWFHFHWRPVFEQMSAQVQALKFRLSEFTEGRIHTCHDECERIECKLSREVERLRKELAECCDKSN